MKKGVLWSIILVCTAIISLVVIAQNESLDSEFEEIGKNAQNLIQQQKAVGLAIYAVKNNFEHEWFLGATQAGNDLPPNNDTLFEIGSITKTFTALLLADKVARGEIDLDSEIAPALPPSVVSPWHQSGLITWRNLVTHMTGLPNISILYTPPDLLNPYAKINRTQMYQWISGRMLEVPPGQKFEYTNLGYGLLGELLASTSRTTYKNLLREKILRPLKMTSTYLDVPESKRHLLATGHNRELKPTLPWQFDGMAPTGGLKSSLNDMKKYLHALLDRKPSMPIAYQESARILVEDLCRKGGSAGAFNYGWPIGLCGENGQIALSDVQWFTGQTGGFTAFIAISRSQKIGLIVLSNSSDIYPEDPHYVSEQTMTFFGLRSMRILGADLHASQ